MARTVSKVPLPEHTIPASAANVPPTPIKYAGWGGGRDWLYIHELDNGHGEVIMKPHEYDQRGEYGPREYWRTEALGCFKTTFIYQQIAPHPRLAEFIRPDEWTGLPILRKPTGPQLDKFLKDHKASMYHQNAEISRSTAPGRVHDRYKPLMYQWALQLANAFAYIHSHGEAETPIISIIYGDLHTSCCWLSKPSLSLSLVGFLDAQFSTPQIPFHLGSCWTGLLFHPYSWKSKPDDLPTVQSDIFLWACFVYELMTGEWPGYGQGLAQQEIEMLVPRKEWPELEADYLGDIIHMCWKGEITRAADLMKILQEKIGGLGWQIQDEDELMGFDAAHLFDDKRDADTAIDSLRIS
ncbi:Hypothetical protein D9617_20g027080 [Elsinoe fawcettii]|nr:Hypothetical protein D9617_20g027080 [Elsinoe fawcettii]